MTDKEIIKALECCTSESIEDYQVCPYAVDTIYCEQMKLRADALDLINRQQEQLEAAIAGQETLQKALAEKDRENERITAEKDQLIKTFGECQAEATKALVDKDKEIERLKNNVFCSVVIDEGKMRNIVNEKVSEFELDIESIKSEAIKECIEKTQAFLAIKCRGVVEDNPNLDEILWGYRKEDVDEFFDNLVKEMVGDTE